MAINRPILNRQTPHDEVSERSLLTCQLEAPGLARGTRAEISTSALSTLLQLDRLVPSWSVKTEINHAVGRIAKDCKVHRALGEWHFNRWPTTTADTAYLAMARCTVANNSRHRSKQLTLSMSLGSETCCVFVGQTTGNRPQAPRSLQSKDRCLMVLQIPLLPRGREQNELVLVSVSLHVSIGPAFFWRS